MEFVRKQCLCRWISSITWTARFTFYVFSGYNVYRCFPSPFCRGGSESLVLLRIWGFLRYATIIGGLASLSSNNVTRSIATLATIRHMLLWYFGILLKSSVVWELFEDRRACESRLEITGWGRVYLAADNDGLYAEVPLWCASGPIARRWIVPTCVWKLSDYKNGSECW
jgi:hypothetical protein